MSYNIKQWRSNDAGSNYYYAAIPAANITVGTTDVSSFYTTDGNTFTQATGVAQTGVTYYKISFDILSTFGLTAINKLGIQAPFLTKFNLEINGLNTITISIGYSGFYELDNELITVTGLEFAEDNEQWTNIIVDAIGTIG